jgi:hypothetical protein
MMRGISERGRRWWGWGVGESDEGFQQGQSGERDELQDVVVEIVESSVRDRAEGVGGWVLHAVVLHVFVVVMFVVFIWIVVVKVQVHVLIIFITDIAFDRLVRDVGLREGGDEGGQCGGGEMFKEVGLSVGDAS